MNRATCDYRGAQNAHCSAAPVGTVIVSGVPVDHCGTHEPKLPPLFRRPKGQCWVDGCRSITKVALCHVHRPMFARHGVLCSALEEAMPEESAVSEAVVPPADGEVAAHLSAIAKIEQDLRARRDAVAARLVAMGASVYGYTYEADYTLGPVQVTLPLNDKGVPVEVYARQVEAAERALAGLEAAKAEPDPAEPSAGDVVDALSGRWGQVHSAPLPEDGDVWPPPAAMAVARAWAAATGEEAAHLGRQIRSLCDSDMEVIAVKATARAEIADLQRTEALAERATREALAEEQFDRQLGDALADRDRARRERDEAEAGETAVRKELAATRERFEAAQAQLSAIADLLNEDEERSPSFGADDEPIPLVDRVRVALMPDGFGQSAWERRLTRELDRCGAPEGFSPYLRTALIAQALKDERERTKEQAQEIYDAGRVLTILGAPPHLPLREALMRVLSPKDRRAVLEVEAAEARAALARVKARRVDPATPQELAEYEARAAAAQVALNELPAGEEG